MGQFRIGRGFRLPAFAGSAFVGMTNHENGMIRQGMAVIRLVGQQIMEQYSGEC